MYATRGPRVAYIEMSSSTDVFLWILEQNSRSYGQVSPPFPEDRHKFAIQIQTGSEIFTIKISFYILCKHIYQ